MPRHKRRRSSTVARQNKRKAKRFKSPTIAVQVEEIGGAPTAPLPKFKGGKNRSKQIIPQRKITTRKAKGVQKPSFTTVVTDVISTRGRPTFAAGPQAGQPQTAQNILLSSTAIADYKYDERLNILRITFVKGGIYDYFGVPILTVLALGRAGSKGRYFYYNIRTNYNFRRVK